MLDTGSLGDDISNHWPAQKSSHGRTGRRPKGNTNESQRRKREATTQHLHLIRMGFIQIFLGL